MVKPKWHLEITDHGSWRTERWKRLDQRHGLIVIWLFTKIVSDPRDGCIVYLDRYETERDVQIREITSERFPTEDQAVAQVAWLKDHYESILMAEAL